MTALTVYPYTDVLPALFRDFLADAPRIDTPRARGFRVDVVENDRAYTMSAELPGVKKEEITVDIDANQVSIRTESKVEREAKQGERVLRTERHVGQFSRSFALPVEIDDAQASAKFENGVLELTLPKKVAPAAKRLTIN